MSKTCTGAEMINQLLPQTQCTECGYSGCEPYAAAISAGKDTINHCHPGGLPTLFELAKQLKVDPRPYITEIAQRASAPQIAVIIESDCIGCTKCIQACPVDAIIGAAKLMHTVINQECTGCGLCISPCPVDCIELKLIDKSVYDHQKARKRYEAQQNRFTQQQQQKKSLSVRYLATNEATTENDCKDKETYIQAAIARVRIKKARLKEK